MQMAMEEQTGTASTPCYSDQSGWATQAAIAETDGRLEASRRDAEAQSGMACEAVSNQSLD